MAFYISGGTKTTDGKDSPIVGKKKTLHSSFIK